MRGHPTRLFSIQTLLAPENGRKKVAHEEFGINRLSQLGMTISASNQASQYYRSLIETQAQDASFQKMQELARETKAKVKESSRADAAQTKSPEPAPRTIQAPARPKATLEPPKSNTTPPPDPAPDIRQVVQESERKQSAKAQAEAADKSRAMAESAARAMERNRDAKQIAAATRQRFAAAA